VIGTRRGFANSALGSQGNHSSASSIQEMAWVPQNLKLVYRIFEVGPLSRANRYVSDLTVIVAA
jgi:hypothetical protein